MTSRKNSCKRERKHWCWLDWGGAYVPFGKGSALRGAERWASNAAAYIAEELWERSSGGGEGGSGSQGGGRRSMFGNKEKVLRLENH